MVVTVYLPDDTAINFPDQTNVAEALCVIRETFIYQGGAITEGEGVIVLPTGSLRSGTTYRFRYGVSTGIIICFCRLTFLFRTRQLLQTQILFFLYFSVLTIFLSTLSFPILSYTPFQRSSHYIRHKY